MEENDLRNLLNHLHLEIELIDKVDDKGQELLRDLSADILELLERSGNIQKQTEPINMVHIGDTIRHFEVSHPTLTATLSKLMAILSNAGI